MNIYQRLGDIEEESNIEQIESALGFKLFVWQKAYLKYGKFRFRQMGKTTAVILGQLLDTNSPPMDLTTRQNVERYADEEYSHYHIFYKRAVKEIYDKLRMKGIKTRAVFFTNKQRAEYEKLVN